MRAPASRSEARGVKRFAGFALAAAFLLSASLPATAQDVARDSTLRLGRMTFVATRADTNEVVLEASRVLIPPRSNVAQLEEVHVRMRNPSGMRDSFVLTCDQGDLALDSADFRAEGNVEGETGDGRRIYTTWLRYDSDGGVVSTDAPVRIVDGQRTVSGRGFQYHVRDGRFVLKGGARVVEE
jgi:LPS export ABC transporter protein LptC